MSVSEVGNVGTTQQRADDLLVILQSWRQSGDMPECPTCKSSVLKIKDQSVRPYTEWYRFTCSECGLNETLAVPQASPGRSGIN